jgi:phosphoribosylanthranilate isomerase
MTWIKICGTTNVEDAKLAVSAGADAVGFVFFEKSKRAVEPKLVRQIVAELSRQTEKIGVFVNASADRIQSVVKDAGLTGVQLHGSETAEFARDLFHALGGKVEVIRVVPVNEIPPGKELAYGFDPVSAGILSAEEAETIATEMRDAAIDSGLPPASAADIHAEVVQRVLLDSGSPGEGGTGRPFDWNAYKTFADAISSFTNVIIAGGLTAANVADAIRVLRPWGVDVVSGVEKQPGKKDPEKVRAFVKAVREAERRGGQ